MATLFTLEELQDAHKTVTAVMSPTPQYRWPLLAERAGVNVWVKHENHTPTGAFKIRGGLVYLESLARQSALPEGLITATRGNHGQSIPFAASIHGVPVTVVVPVGNSVEKNRAMTAWGARLVEHGVDFDESKEEAGRLAKAHNLLVVPPFHRELVRGVATYALELLRTVADLKTVYVPIGMGSGVCGLITTRDLLGLETEIVGVVSERAPAYKLSWSARRVVETDSARTFADGVACRVPAAQALEIMLSGAARIVSVSEDETAQAMRFLYSDTHNVAEGAGAVPLAALLKEQREGLHSPQDHVAVVLTGGNVDSDVFAQVLSGETPDVR